MSSSSVPLKSYIVSAHPYSFDAWFTMRDRWIGLGQVTVHRVGGGLNQAHALVEADEQGILALKAAGFSVERLRKELCPPSEDSVVFEKSRAASEGSR
jgi:hypothetical protein